MPGREPFPWLEMLRRVRAAEPEHYRAWFDELPEPAVHSGELRIHVPDASKAAFLRQCCARAFVQAAMELTGHLLSVRFEGPANGQIIAPAARRGAVLQSAPLSVDYTFEMFVVGPSNRLGHAACRAVCNQLGSLYNPLFLHGPSGLGKTHLIHATCAELLAQPTARRVVYVSCETFVNTFVYAIETGQLQDFREQARQADLLAIDDVQFLAGRESTQEELFHTFNALYQSGKQILLSADCAPGEIPTLQDRLVSRFNWGLVAQIDMPNRETRHAILQKKARLRGMEVPDDALDMIAERLDGNIRLLEGALTKLLSETQVNGRPITREDAEHVLSRMDLGPKRLLQVSEIMEVIAKHYGVRLPDLVGRKRSRSISHPRQVGMFLARQLTSLSLEEIGSHFGGRDHSTVLHAERTIRDECERDKATADAVAHLSKSLTARR